MFIGGSTLLLAIIFSQVMTLTTSFRMNFQLLPTVVRGTLSHSARRSKSNHTIRLSSSSSSGESCDTDKLDKVDPMDQVYMKLAVRHAQAAYKDKEVPIGAVLVDSNGTVIAACRNQVEAQQDASAHAELECLRKAAKYFKNWRLTGCTLYTTLEPCPMCLSAIQNFRVKRLVFGTRDLRIGACGSFVDLSSIKHPFHNLEITGGVLKEESTLLLRRFFQGLRQENKRYASYDLGRGVAENDFSVPNESQT